MANRTVRVDFFKVEGARADETLEILRALRGENTPTSGVGDDPIQLTTLMEHAGIVEGDFTRIQMSELPPRTKTSGHKRDLDLDEDEGLGHETAFLFYPPAALLAVQRHRAGASLNAINWLLQTRVDEPAELRIVPIADPNVMKRALRVAKKARKIRIRFATPSSVHSMGKTPITNAATSLMAELAAPSMEITASMKYEEGFLDRAVDVVKELFRARKENPHDEDVSAVVVGHDDLLGRSDEVDIFREFVSERISVPLSRTVQADARRKAVWEAWLRRRGELVGMYS